MDEKRTGGGVRIHLQFNRHPALLLVSNVVAADEGVYRCRVDFGKSPTRNVHVRLDVVGAYIIDKYSQWVVPRVCSKSPGDGASSDTPVYRTFIFLDKSQNY